MKTDNHTLVYSIFRHAGIPVQEHAGRSGAVNYVDILEF